ncbi:Membrane protein involved in the export of O-antigen and teichoic acid [Cyclobacterium lianum]|uniref:Membrane protein involved in the export of O-antigen and teichoic acid n=1 Tax=Cyclobacterium lianum TaxID=388280 RepID=A0A1M7PF93_9BACT|nr:oligosaccharide flippase family protein [Cyclobacterium lianum]SHN15688.1 Membrane protein involved in the export of O-antigen and teichoic acid [Cyclobacterium lianum]
MTDKKYWLKSGFFTMMHRGVDFLLGFIGFMLLVRILAPEDFGVWVLLITIISIIDMARNGLIQNGLIKIYLGKKPAVQAKIQTAAIWLNTGLSMLLFLLIWMSAGPLTNLLHAPDLARILKIYSWILPVLIFHTHNLVLMQARFDFSAYFFAGISKSLPFFLVICIGYAGHLNLSLAELAWYQNGAFFLATLVSFYQVRKYFHIRWRATTYWLGRLFHFGKFVFGTNLVSMLTNSLDKFLLGALLTPVQVALANSAGRMMNMVEIPVNSIASISYPKAAEAHDANHNGEIGRLYEKTVGMMLALTIPFWLFCLVFAHYIILFIAGEDYLNAVPFLRILALLALIKPFDRQSGVFLDAIGKPFFNMIMVFATFVTGAGFSWLFINWYGLEGAAFGLVIALFITAGIKFYLLSRYIPINVFSCLSQAVKNYRGAIDRFSSQSR